MSYGGAGSTRMQVQVAYQARYRYKACVVRYFTGGHNMQLPNLSHNIYLCGIFVAPTMTSPFSISKLFPKPSTCALIFGILGLSKRRTKCHLLRNDSQQSSIHVLCIVSNLRFICSLCNVSTPLEDQQATQSGLCEFPTIVP